MQAIKDDILKQVKNEDSSADKQRGLIIVNKQPSLDRVTNAVIKSILKNRPSETSKSRSQMFPNVEKQIKKKEKTNLKKEIWNKSRILSI